jgi:hypothetical protein
MESCHPARQCAAAAANHPLDHVHPSSDSGKEAENDRKAEKAAEATGDVNNTADHGPGFKATLAKTAGESHGHICDVTPQSTNLAKACLLRPRAFTLMSV